LKNNLNDKITINNFSATLSNGEVAIGECYPKVVKSNSITNCKAEFKSKPSKDYEEATIAIDYNLDPPNFFVFYIVTGVITAPVVQGAGIYMATFYNNPPVGKVSVNGIILENGQSIPLRTGNYSIQAIPKANYSFVQWKLKIINGNAKIQSATQNPTTLFINGTIVVNATYVYAPFTTSTTSTSTSTSTSVSYTTTSIIVSDTTSISISTTSVTTTSIIVSDTTSTSISTTSVSTTLCGFCYDRGACTISCPYTSLCPDGYSCCVLKEGLPCGV
jgi:hypothetical protein